MFCLSSSSASEMGLNFQSVHEWNSICYIHMCTCQQESGTVGQTNRLPSELNFPKAVSENKSYRIYNTYTQESHQKWAFFLLCLLLSLFLFLVLSFNSYLLLAKPHWILNCYTSNPAWLWETVQFQIRSSLRQIMIWSGFEFSTKPVHNLLHVVCVKVTHMCG